MRKLLEFNNQSQRPKTGREKEAASGGLKLTLARRCDTLNAWQNLHWDAVWARF